MNDQTASNGNQALTPISEALKLGRQCHQAGDLQQAERICRDILKTAPEQADAWRLLAATARALGKLDEARAHYEHVFRLDPADAEVCCSLGNLLVDRGEFDQATVCYRQGLQQRPDHVGLHNNLGIILVRLGKTEEALAHYRQSIRLKPDAPGAHSNLGIALAKLGKREEAIQHYREALRLDPKCTQAHFNLANIFRQQGRSADALKHYQQVLNQRPDDADTHCWLGVLLAQQGKWEDAELHYRSALNHQPESIEAHANLAGLLSKRRRFEEAVLHYRKVLHQKPEDVHLLSGLAHALAEQDKLDEAVTCYRQALRLQPHSAGIHNNLGITLARQEKLDEAVAHYREALRLAPKAADFHNNLAIVLAKQGNFADAERHYRESLRLKPNAPGAISNLGNALRDQGKFGEAILLYRQALRLKPDAADVHNNLAVALVKQRSVDEGLAHYEECLRLEPDYAEAHTNRAQALLLKGDFAKGCPEFEWRWKCKNAGPRHTQHPRWDGSPLQGCTILLHAEQGSGDTLQFIRYAQLVKQRGATVFFECPQPLKPLLKSCLGIDQCFAQEEQKPAFDCHAPLMSLPGLVGTTLETIPADIPYLFADEECIERWRDELGHDDHFKIGIAWQGNTRYGGDRHRSLALRHFLPLAWLEGVQLYSLQKGFGSEQLKTIGDQTPIVDLGGRNDVDTVAFLDTAAIMKNLDLVITSDTAIAHLAGGLGVPVWVVLPTTSDWRWFLGREDSPWYPTLRLFRQTQLGNWEAVILRLMNELRQKLAARMCPAIPQSAGRIDAEISAGELLDKIAILQIKSERIKDPDKLHNVRMELATLTAARDRIITRSDVTPLMVELKTINEALWDIEDAIRACERAREFGPRFIELARSVYYQNDRRDACKRRINDLAGSKLVEEKSYAAYDRPTSGAEAERQGPSNVVKCCRYGQMLFQPHDVYIGRSFDLYGEFSEAEVAFFRTIVKPGQTVLDVGANIGAHTVPLAQLVGRAGRVLAFEPQRIAYYALCANVVLNNLHHVSCHHAAAGKGRQVIKVPELDYSESHNFGGVSLCGKRDGPTTTVPVLRIDDLKLTECHLMKIDVEGMERDVLEGAVETLKRFKPILYVEDDRKEKSAALRAFIADQGYAIYVHKPPYYNPNNFFGNADNVFPNIVSLNLYCHHRDVSSPIRPQDFAMQGVQL